MSHEQTLQAALGLAAAILGIFAVTRKPKPVEQTTAPVGPSGFGEVGGGGGGGGYSPASSSLAGAPTGTRGGEQTPTAGNPEAGSTGPVIGKLVPKYRPPIKPGEGEQEYLNKLRETALPGARARIKP